MLTTWRKELEKIPAKPLAGPHQTTLTDADLDREFDPGYGGPEGCAFTLWTLDRVYFPATYDGAEWVDSVRRHPCGEATDHIGG